MKEKRKKKTNNNKKEQTKNKKSYRGDRSYSERLNYFVVHLSEGFLLS